MPGGRFVNVCAQELSVPDTVLSLVWAGSSLCVGFKKEYALVHVTTGAMSPIFSTGATQRSLSTVLPGSILLLGRDGGEFGSSSIV